ncbi:MAG: hypothetical protein IIB99_05725 [Planctomycetes bacterium]|nr:hypothetical protein [Planctomycetota bacterium]MCH8210855.1 hypothetical protein [Planctomycetota bacterium]
MTTHTDMTELRMDLELLRDHLVAGTLQERQAWTLLDRTGTLLDQAPGGPFEENLRVIYSLVSVVWNNLRQLKRLHEAMPGE